MKALLQRVSSAAVSVDGHVVGQIGQGLMVLCGFGKEDTEQNLKPILEKLLNLRIFAPLEPESDAAGKFDKSLLDIRGELLLVPQFTLYAETAKGRRPDFFSAKPPVEASQLFDKLLVLSKSYDLKVSSGIFGANMQVSLVNDGPVTIMLEN